MNWFLKLYRKYKKTMAYFRAYAIILTVLLY